ncbi:MAG: hypothetical protein IPM29_13480 [Planctomycetes bacterium]|nr:hypothetical protein [Planctomycetota bacterium]
MLSRFTFLGGRRRTGGRRPGENEAVFVDLYGPGLLLVVLAIVVLNFLDAWFTTLFLSMGGQELNPIVDHVLGWGSAPFALLKSLGIGLCVIMLTMTKGFRIARLGLGVILGGYALLLGWHLFLLTHVAE